jgi:ABC-2 type transport system permease protein
VVLPLGTSVLAERDQGNLQRLALLNVSPLKLLAAKFPAYYLLNLVQLAIMLAVGAWLVPAIGGDRLELRGSAAGLWLIGSALSLAAIGFGLLVAVLARSAVQATTLGGVANLVLGAVGGVMVPKLVMPPAMQAASNLSPMSWALEGCWDILLRGGGVADVLPEAAALAAFALATFLAATALFPRTGP